MQSYTHLADIDPDDLRFPKECRLPSCREFAHVRDVVLPREMAKGRRVLEALTSSGRPFDWRAFEVEVLSGRHVPAIDSCLAYGVHALSAIDIARSVAGTRLGTTPSPFDHVSPENPRHGGTLLDMAQVRCACTVI